MRKPKQTPKAAPSIYEILEEIEELELIEDRREYTSQDLQRCYHLEPQAAEDLYYLIHRVFDHSLGGTEPPNHIPSWVHKEYYLESSEGNFEGFEEHDKVVIQKWLDDMGRYWKNVKDEPDRDPTTGRTANGTYGSERADA